MIRVCIVDDQRLMREGLETLIGLEPDIDVVATGENGEEAIQAAENFSIDVMLLDIRMPVKNGIEAIIGIAEVSPNSRVLMLTTYDTRDDVVGALSAGAVGYLLKDMPAEEIAEAIRTADAGGAVLPPGIANTFLSAIQMKGVEMHRNDEEKEAPSPQNKEPSHVGMGVASPGQCPTDSSPMTAEPTERERDVLHCLAQGLSNKGYPTRKFLSSFM